VNLEHLRNLPIEDLRVAGSQISGFPNLPRLKSLSISTANLPDFPTRSRRLETFTLETSRGFDLTLFRANFPKLTTLDMTVDSIDLTKFPSLPRLTTLTISKFDLYSNIQGNIAADRFPSLRLFKVGELEEFDAITTDKEGPGGAME